jgi:hypothetical protein
MMGLFYQMRKRTNNQQKFKVLKNKDFKSLEFIQKTKKLDILIKKEWQVVKFSETLKIFRLSTNIECQNL